ncbi:hypothetical protein OGAPHI_005732 [Ogataea philodendri]|uniref:Peptide:N-glycanase 1 n=1 Tax=Ogataea philodendri TaxID=1378263 RepID=A0A9P8T211_9ASCO|nr:uncharacterized protein OGAPHI_005732 [Ogataea philodendri]KAH3662480.1 hypothetical protein OGAPHI_005732 [Ogataea philodendri]
MIISEVAKYYKDQYAESQREHIRRLLQEKRPSNGPFARQVAAVSHLMDKYMDSDAQSAALDVVLESGIYDKLEPFADEPDYIDRLVKSLLEWYKNEFFQWINKPACECGNSDQNQIQPLQPMRPYTRAHFEGQAGIVERYKCGKCSKTIEFPRYNNPKTLLSFRKGRCGEWNNCFILILCSLGLNVRYVWNAEDHVWCEFFSKNLNRWIHLDSCENQFDNPTLYCTGWGKKMSYVFAIHRNYIADVSAKYIKKNQLPRDKISEQQLADTMAYINLTKWLTLDTEDLLTTLADFMNDSRTRTLAPTPSPAKQLPRQSGAPEWTATRGEAGSRNQ